MMGKKVEELVEWTARRVGVFDTHLEWDRLSLLSQQRARDEAIQILSHPDLALIDKVNEDVKVTRAVSKSKDAPIIWIPLVAVIPLAEALEEKK